MHKKIILSVFALVVFTADLSTFASSGFARCGGCGYRVNAYGNGDDYCPNGGGRYNRDNYNQGFGRRGSGMGYGGYNRSLSPEQQSQFQSMHTDFQEQTKQIRLSLANKQGQYRALLSSSDPNPEQAGKLSAEIEALRQQMHAARTEFRQEAQNKFGNFR